MHINATFWYLLIRYEDFNEDVVAKQYFLTLTCCNILGLIKKWHLDTYDKISAYWPQKIQLYIYTLHKTTLIRSWGWYISVGKTKGSNYYDCEWSWLVISAKNILFSPQESPQTFLCTLPRAICTGFNELCKPKSFCAY